MEIDFNFKGNLYFVKDNVFFYLNTDADANSDSEISKWPT